MDNASNSGSNGDKVETTKRSTEEKETTTKRDAPDTGKLNPSEETTRRETTETTRRDNTGNRE